MYLVIFFKYLVNIKQVRKKEKKKKGIKIKKCFGYALCQQGGPENYLDGLTKEMNGLFLSDCLNLNTESKKPPDEM